MSTRQQRRLALKKAKKEEAKKKKVTKSIADENLNIPEVSRRIDNLSVQLQNLIRQRDAVNAGIVKTEGAIVALRGLLEERAQKNGKRTKK